MDLFPIDGPLRDETGEMHRRTNALIHGWGKYTWMINLYEWVAIWIRSLAVAAAYGYDGMEVLSIPLSSLLGYYYVEYVVQQLQANRIVSPA